MTHNYRCDTWQTLAGGWDVTCQLPLCRVRWTFPVLGRPRISNCKGKLGDFPADHLASICIVNSLIFTYTVHFRSIKRERVYRSCNSFYLTGKWELLIPKVISSHINISTWGGMMEIMGARKPLTPSTSWTSKGKYLPLYASPILLPVLQTANGTREGGLNPSLKTG